MAFTEADRINAQLRRVGAQDDGLDCPISADDNAPDGCVRIADGVSEGIYDAARVLAALKSLPETDWQSVWDAIADTGEVE